jgi:hypothetical protein
VLADSVPKRNRFWEQLSDKQTLRLVVEDEDIHPFFTKEP